MAEQKNNTNILLGVLMILVVISGIVSVYGAVANREVKLDTSNLENSLSAMVSKLESIDTKVTDTAVDSEVPVETPSDRLTDAVDKILSRDDEEVIVENLSTEYLSEKDFKKDLMEYLNDNSVENQSIENYRDITSIVVKDVEVDYNDRYDNATVIFEVKVTYFNDGDDEEEDAEKARLEVVLNLEGLDEDDNFEDAETEVGSFDLIKVY